MKEFRLAAACKSLGETWLPPNPAVVEAVSAKLRRGHYNKDASDLVEDLKADPVLFAYFLQSLSRMVHQGAIPKPPAFNIEASFQAAGPQVLQRILLERGGKISQHSLDQAGHLQTARLEECLVSAATSDVLAERANFPRSAGYAAAVLRQFGMCLIAWNYPHIYRQAMEGARRGEKAEVILMKLLGYSPHMLSVALVHDWGLGTDFQVLVGTKGVPDESGSTEGQKLSEVAGVLRKICEVGETLARASQSEQYPEAGHEWSSASKFVTGVLGPQGVELIQAKLTSYCKEYLKTKAPIIGMHHLVVKDTTPHQTEADTDVPNRYLALCPEQLQDLIRTLYARLSSSKPLKENILYLTQQIAPQAGFRGGCIFTFDLESHLLVPRYVFGKASASFDSLECSPLAPAIHPAVEAFRVRDLVCEINPWSENSEMGYIAASFGNIQRVGVLYLEIASSMSHVGREDTVNRFYAVRQTLMDCLNLK